MNSIDIIIPVKNEAKTIKQLVNRLDAALSSNKISYTLIFVNDRSIDDTILEIENLKKKYPIKLLHKKGKPGKAYSIIEGISLAKTEYVVMLDADLEYPPEAIPEMYLKAQQENHGVIVANRANYSRDFLRTFASRMNALFIGRLLFGFRCDVQSGLKLFKREIVAHIDTSIVSPWSLDIPLLFTNLELGYSIGTVSVTFDKRETGKSKINIVNTAWDILKSSFRLKFKKRKMYQIEPLGSESMLEAGIVHKRKRFITHSTLHKSQSAIMTLTFWQKFVIAFIFGIFIGGLFLNTIGTAIAVVAVLSLVYFLDVLFSLYLTTKSLHFPPEITFSDEEIGRLRDGKLPTYTVLCPLYKEAHVLPQFTRAMSQLDWPKNKLEVLLLLEADDKETIERAKAMNLPEYMRIEIVPESQPKTKPKACNYGLAKAQGEYVVIYDAEDIPDPLQLKKAYVAFINLGKQFFCLQAKLNYYNPHDNLLTRLFTAEYSLWFDVLLPGLQSIDAAIPLGGTSNHFRTKDLLAIHGWDPFNVTEDADLGVRLFKKGYSTAIIDSTTYEEANGNFTNWLRQRSRWIKGYIQTYFVHMRNPFSFIRNHGIQAFIFQLVIGGKIAFMFINPLLWVLTIAYFALYSVVGPTIESLYPTSVFYMAAFSLVVGNFLYIYNYMIGTAKRGHWSVVKFVFLIPFYWLMVSTSAVMAVIQLIFKPHYWEKTQHGLHLRKSQLAKISDEMTQVPSTTVSGIAPASGRFSGLFQAGIFVFGLMVSNVLNLLYNTYVGRVVSPVDFGLVSLLGNFFYLTQIPLASLGGTITHKSAFILGKYAGPATQFWSLVKRSSLKISLMVCGLWLFAIPLLATFFQNSSYIPFVIFTPVWILATSIAVDTSFLSGNQKFHYLALVVIGEGITKLLISLAMISFGLSQYVYAAIPVSLAVSALLAFVLVKFFIKKTPKLEIPVAQKFPWKFYATLVLSRLSLISFLSMDLLLAKHYLDPEKAGAYALLSLVGKMIFYLGSIMIQFVNPIISKFEGAGKNSRSVFNVLFLITIGAAFAGFILLGFIGDLTVPLIFGAYTAEIIPYLVPFTFGMACFTIANTLLVYHQAKKEYFFSIVSFGVTMFQIIGIMLFHQDIGAISQVMYILGVVHLLVMLVLHLIYPTLLALGQNVLDFFELFGKISPVKSNQEKLKILVLNWRDTKHVWAGGAEVYVHELAKEWVKSGHSVTVFCGNDGKHKRNEVIDGVQMIRRGGFYTVYLWAALYYVLKLRGNFDVIIDSENGIPFFAPLYARIPTVLLIHHVHQDVFREHLFFPLSVIARFIESWCMPFIYRNNQVITVSDSSQKAIEKLGLGKAGIAIVPPGVKIPTSIEVKKATHPLFTYVGRLKPYKNIETILHAFALILKLHPSAELIIAGTGESLDDLKKVSKSLAISDQVKFMGLVSESMKQNILARSWLALQPSSFEGWGLTVIEANAVGTPVIASKVNGLKDSVNHGKSGLLVEVKNSYSFAKAMDKLITDKTLLKDYSKNARIWAKTFDWKESADSFLQTLTKTTIETKKGFSVRIGRLFSNI